MKVPLFDLSKQHALLREELREAMDGVLESQQFILGKPVADLETAMSAQLGSRHAVACASGSDALLLALMAIELQPGEAVITVPFTFFATAAAISRLGAFPCFVDIDSQTFNLDPASLRKFLVS